MKHLNFIIFLSITLFWVLLWIIFNVYHSSTASTVSEVLQVQTVPIDGQFDPAALDIISKRHVITPIYTLSGGSSRPTPTPLSNNVIPASSSGTQTVTAVSPTTVALPTPTGGLP